MNKKVLWIIGILVVVVLGLVALKKAGAFGKDEGIKVSAEKATKRTIIETVTASGKIYPESTGESVVAIRGTDSVKTKSKNGFFVMRVRPGNWKVIVSGREQTKNIVRDNLIVTQGQQVNLGEIRLSE